MAARKSAVSCVVNVTAKGGMLYGAYTVKDLVDNSSEADAVLAATNKRRHDNRRIIMAMKTNNKAGVSTRSSDRVPEDFPVL